MNKVIFTNQGQLLRDELRTDQLKLKLDTSRKKKMQTSPESLKLNNDKCGTPASIIQKTNEESQYKNESLYKKSESEVALQRIQKIARLSIMGQPQSKRLEQEIKNDLPLPKIKNSEQKYLNNQITSLVKKLINTNQKSFTQGKMKLQQESKQLNTIIERSKLTHSLPTIQNESTNKNLPQIQDYELLNKMQEIVYAEGRLERIYQRSQKQLLDNEKVQMKLDSQYKIHIDKLNSVLDTMKPPSPRMMKSSTQETLLSLVNDENYRSRLTNRLKSIQKFKTEPYWKKHSVPYTKRWIAQLSDVKEMKE